MIKEQTADEMNRTTGTHEIKHLQSRNVPQRFIKLERRAFFDLLRPF
jgi:hypothetical protein